MPVAVLMRLRNDEERHTGLLLLSSEVSPFLLLIGDSGPHLKSDGKCPLRPIALQSYSVASEKRPADSLKTVSVLYLDRVNFFASEA